MPAGDPRPAADCFARAAAHQKLVGARELDVRVVRCARSSSNDARCTASQPRIPCAAARRPADLARSSPSRMTTKLGQSASSCWMAALFSAALVQTIPPAAFECGPRLGVREHRGRHHVGFADDPLDIDCVGFVHVELHEVAGIEVDGHRRSSITICDVGVSRDGTLTSAREASHPPTSPGPSPPSHAPSPASAPGHTGPRIAIARPRSVTSADGLPGPASVLAQLRLQLANANRRHVASPHVVTTTIPQCGHE